MARVEINKKAPEFEMKDYTGKEFKLSDFRGKRNIVIVFNRGLFDPFAESI